MKNNRTIISGAIGLALLGIAAGGFWAWYTTQKEKEELQALREDYHLIPDRHSVLAYRMVRRALDGDAELALLLLSMSVYDDDLDRIFLENSVLLRTLFPPDPPDPLSPVGNQ